MDIAHFIHRFPPALGGAEAYFARLTHFLQSQGDTVQVWTTTAIDLSAFWKAGQRECEASPGPEVRRYQPWHFPARRYLLKLVSLIPLPRWQAWTLPCNPICPQMMHDVDRYEGRLDAVHASAFPYSFPIACALRLARRRNVPFFLTPFLHLGDLQHAHNRTRRQYLQPALKWLLRQADGVFVQTQAEFQAVADLGVGPERIVLQGLGVNPEECTGGNRDLARTRWGVRAGDLVIGHLANLSQEKGTIDLLQATAGRWQVILAGPQMPNFLRFWKTYPHKHSVRLLGQLSDTDKRDFFAGIDLFCLPSRTDSFGLVLLEAWANQKPVVVYGAGGPGEIVHDGIDGLIATCDVRALAQSLEHCQDSRWLETMGQSGYQRVNREFAWQPKLQLVREHILARCRGPAGQAGS